MPHRKARRQRKAGFPLPAPRQDTLHIP